MLDNLERLSPPRRRRLWPYAMLAIAAAGGTFYLGKKDTGEVEQNVPATSTTAVFELDTQTLPPTLPPGEVATTIAEGTILPIDHHPSTLPSDTIAPTITVQTAGSTEAVTTEAHDHPAPAITIGQETAPQVATPAPADTHQHPAPVIPVAEQPVTVTTAVAHDHPAPVVVVTPGTPAPTTLAPVETAPATLAPVGTPETVPPTLAPPVGTILAPSG